MEKAEARIEMIVSKLAEAMRFFWNEFRWMIFSGMMTALVSYHLFIIDGYSTPDGICEGLYYYTSHNWALENGRWATRYVNLLLTHNINIPLFSVFFSASFILAGLVVIIKLLKIRAQAERVVLAILFISSPVLVIQMTYLHHVASMALAFFTSCLFVLFAGKEKPGYFIVAGCMLAVSLGLYQTYISAAIVLVLIVLECLMLEETDKHVIFRKILRYLLCGLFGVILYYVIFKLELYVRGFEPAGRVSEFSVSEILVNLKQTLFNSYVLFLKYYLKNVRFQERWLNLILMCFVLLSHAVCVKRIIKRKNGLLQALIITLILFLFPVALNITEILIPYFKPYSLMMYHYILLVPYEFFLIRVLGEPKIKGETKSGIPLSLLRYTSLICAAGIALTSVLSANSTFLMMRTAYRAILSESEAILSDVYRLDEYEFNETPIVLAGFPDDTLNYHSQSFNKFTVDPDMRMAFWNSVVGATNNRYWFFRNYFGIDAKQITEEDYRRIIQSDDFMEMPLWPKAGSVKMIDGMAVVKLSEEPPQ